MSKNRVEELESTVAELESAVEGLTEELVETKERVRVLEDQLELESPSRVPQRRESTSDDAVVESTDAESPADDAEQKTESSDEEAQDSGTDDIIVA